MTKRMRNPLNGTGTATVEGRDDSLPTDQPNTLDEATLPSANGTGSESAGPGGSPVQNGAASRRGKPKGERTVFYLLVGRTKDGDSVDVLGEYGTRNQAAKALDGMGMATKRFYQHVKVFQCRDKSNA